MKKVREALEFIKGELMRKIEYTIVISYICLLVYGIKQIVEIVI